MPLEASFTGSSTGGKIRGLNHSQTTMGNSKTIDHQPIQVAAPDRENASRYRREPPVHGDGSISLIGRAWAVRGAAA